MKSKFKVFFLLIIFFNSHLALAEEFICPLDLPVMKMYNFERALSLKLEKSIENFKQKGGSDKTLKLLIIQTACVTRLNPEPFMAENLYEVKQKYRSQFDKVFAGISKKEADLLTASFKNIENTDK